MSLPEDPLDDESAKLSLSKEQLQELLDRMLRKNSLSNCPLRFSGRRDHDVVEAFVGGLLTYKEVEQITDENALKGISLLFDGFASTWWQGVRKEAKSWPDAINMIREHFAPTKPAYQIYMDIFSSRQDEQTPIDMFVCQKRALLARLPDDRHDQETQLDLIYGLLHHKYRKYLPRHEVSSFKALLEQGRIIEHNNRQEQAAARAATFERGGGDKTKAKRCTYCNYRGHTLNECRKRKQIEADATPTTAADDKEQPHKMAEV